MNEKLKEFKKQVGDLEVELADNMYTAEKKWVLCVGNSINARSNPYYEITVTPDANMTGHARRWVLDESHYHKISSVFEFMSEYGSNELVNALPKYLSKQLEQYIPSKDQKKIIDFENAKSVRVDFSENYRGR